MHIKFFKNNLYIIILFFIYKALPAQSIHDGLRISLSDTLISPRIVVRYDDFDRGTGNTSMNFERVDIYKWSGESPYNHEHAGYYDRNGREIPYMKRDRDLGQTFRYDGQQPGNLTAVTVRLGVGSNVARPGIYGRKMSIQIFEVTGMPVLNDNGSDSASTAFHGFPHFRDEGIPGYRDDYFTGETYRSIAVFKGGFFPKKQDFGFASDTVTVPRRDPRVIGKFLTFHLPKAPVLVLEPGKTYAFLLIIDEMGDENGFTLANNYYGHYPGGHGIRRDGDGTFPPATPDVRYDFTHPKNKRAYEAAHFPADMTKRAAIPPGTNGYPDVDTWRDLVFYIEAEPTLDVAATIYNPDAPAVVNVWNRVGDQAPVLRSVESAALSPDGSMAVSVSKFGGNLMAWRAADGALLYAQKQEAEIECIVFSPDGASFATGGEDNFVRTYDAQTGKILRAYQHDCSFDGIAWSHDGKTIAGGTEKGEVLFLDAQTLAVTGKIAVGSTVNSLQYTRDDRYIVAGGNIQTPDPATKKTVYSGFVSLVDVAARQVIRRYEGPKGSVKSVRISGNQRLIAAGSFDNAAYVFDLASGRLLHTFQEPKKIEALAFSPGDHFLLTGGHQRMITFYRLRDFQKVYELPSPRTEYIDLSADGRLMLTAHEDSGLVSLYLFQSDMQDKGALYHELEGKLLKNKDLRGN